MGVGEVWAVLCIIMEALIRVWQLYPLATASKARLAPVLQLDQTKLMQQNNHQISSVEL